MGCDEHEMVPFGAAKVSVEEKRGLVDAVFRRVSDRYDMMNDLMSGRLHRVWKDAALSWLAPPCTGRSYDLLDVAGGTGDMAFRVRDCSPGARIVVLDFNAGMLESCRTRARETGRTGLRFVQADGESLPFADKSFDACVISFGMRNMTRLEKALSEIFRVLRTGGRFICLEFSHVGDPFLRSLYDLYSFNIIPWMGRFFVGDAGPYAYLVESIRTFPDQEALVSMMREAGFGRVSYRNMSGGVVALHSGWRL